ncbi:MupA/Atu3671 family FMN-dependent luciferase-like monooxygenase [Plantactinospora sp. KBS50]|uniref:MupA/Atu3671 family FMN-dependent luciferase-like monooxygenase n=1 Tax=Plantactinospora sp. KBS50 TaxID=2024580 RepID=UPI000BAAA2C9|nr:MupA/Atu3671 family FMN-dependent luciferase-like monooxygenase [Plantactinospora sp. KBS50]ASW54770.1 LLM class flavin-dependent oxidoreductase [Plantactinospora sp. KBS50]
MDFSLFYFANDSEAETVGRYRLLIDGATFADRNGLAAVWTPERHFHPFGGLYPNPAVTSAAIATITERIQIRAGSVVAPLHSPLRIAEEWSMVDNLSDGRAGVSFASGWHAVDFALRPDSYRDRRTILFDQIDQVRRLWRGEQIEVVDGAGGLSRVGVYPPPVQPELPIWVTSAGGIETFRNAGRCGAGLLTHLLGQELDELAVKIKAYRTAVAARPGADSWPGHVVLMVHTYLNEDEDAAEDLVRQPLSAYLRSSLQLLLGARLDGARPMDPDRLSEEDREFLVARSFQRYFHDGGLLGSVDKATGMVERFAAVGVDEVACLIDFGLPTATVLAGLDRLAVLSDRVR